MKEEFLNTPPEVPSALDCCNSGCTPCVFDIYESQLTKWKNKETNVIKDMRNDLLSETKFKPFTLLKKLSISSDTYLLRFQPNLLNDTITSSTKSSSLEQVIPGTLPYTPGMHFIMKSDVMFSKKAMIERGLFNVTAMNTEVSSSKSGSEDERCFITRAYTPISLSSKEPNCCFNIIVKLYKNGSMSKYINRLKVGDIIYFRGPYGDFHYTLNMYKVIYMMCIGSGISPIYPIISHILNDENDETVLKLLYGSRNIEDILLRDELQRFTSYWNFTLKYFISNKTTNNLSKKFGENFVFNRINETEIFEELSSRTLDNALILICGTNEFNNTVSAICSKYGVGNQNIHVFQS